MTQPRGRALPRTPSEKASRITVGRGLRMGEHTACTIRLRASTPALGSGQARAR